MTFLVVDGIHGHRGATSLSFRDGLIESIGEKPSADAERVPGVIWPGLRDSHIHPLEVAAAGRRVDLGEARSWDDVAEAIRGRASSLPPGEPVIAMGLDDERLAEGELPTSRSIDEMVDDRPTLVYRHCSHVASANTLALDLAGIDATTPDPDGGRIRRDAAGLPTGLLDETAISLVTGALAPSVSASSPDDVTATLVDLRRRGIVAIDAMVATGASTWCAGGDEIATLLEIGTPPIGIDVFVIASDPAALTTAARRLRSAPDGIRFAGWKGFADGSLGAGTAALRAPYADRPSTSGLTRMTIDDMTTMAEAAHGLGGIATIHAIGDAAVGSGIAVAERMGRDGVRIEHASVAGPDQIEAMTEAGVTASIQPSFWPSDAPWLEKRLGTDRLPWVYPFRTMLDAGVRLVGGSDAPIEDPNPFVGMADAVRERPGSVTSVEAVDMYAASPLTPGSPATFLVADRPAADDAEGLAGTAVHRVYVRGRRAE